MASKRIAGRKSTAAAAPPAEAAPLLEWSLRQALADTGGTNRLSDPVEVIHRTGWINTAGGSGPYLAIRARSVGFTRAALDRAVFVEKKLVEVPTVRRCWMLVPREEAPLALRAGLAEHEEHAAKVARVCDLQESELGKLKEAIVRSLGRGPLTIDTLRAVLPSGLVRNLGETGKKLGETSSLVFAVRDLTARGVLERANTEKRLDRSKFSYALAPAGLADIVTRAVTPGRTLVDLAQRFQRWAAPVSPAEFARWVGVPQKDAKEALAAAAPPPEVSGRLSAAPRFLPLRDNYLSFRRSVAPFLAPEHARVAVLDWMNKSVVLGTVESLHHHAVVSDGRLLALWEYDPHKREVVVAPLGKLDAETRRVLSAETQLVSRFVEEELGEVTIYALDNDRTRGPRVDALRKLREKSKG